MAFDQLLWEQKRFDIVARGNKAKFMQNADLRNFLFKTGNKIIVEASPVDAIWGIGLAENDSDARNPHKWPGLNLLGFVLMKVRDNLYSHENHEKNTHTLEL